MLLHAIPILVHVSSFHPFSPVIFHDFPQVEAPEPPPNPSSIKCPMISLGFSRKEVFPHQIHRIQGAVISHRFHQSSTLPEIRYLWSGPGLTHLKWERTSPQNLTKIQYPVFAFLPRQSCRGIPCHGMRHSKSCQTDTLENVSPASNKAISNTYVKFRGVLISPSTPRYIGIPSSDFSPALGNSDQLWKVASWRFISGKNWGKVWVFHGVRNGWDLSRWTIDVVWYKCR